MEPISAQIDNTRHAYAGSELFTLAEDLFSTPVHRMCTAHGLQHIACRDSHQLVVQVDERQVGNDMRITILAASCFSLPTSVTTPCCRRLSRSPRWSRSALLSYGHRVQDAGTAGTFVASLNFNMKQSTNEYSYLVCSCFACFSWSGSD